MLKERASLEEGWKTLEKECQVHEENLESEKAAFDAALEEEKGLRGAAETRIEALEGELKDAHTELRKTEANLNKARVKIRTAVADFKQSTVFENYVESRRQQWLSDFHRSPGFQVKM